jgi:hypothetical protein
MHDDDSSNGDSDMLGAGAAFDEHALDENEALNGDLGGAWQAREAPASDTGAASPDTFVSDPFSVGQSSA